MSDDQNARQILEASRDFGKRMGPIDIGMVKQPKSAAAEFFAWLCERHASARETAMASDSVAPGSYGTGYDHGVASAYARVIDVFASYDTRGELSE